MACSAQRASTSKPDADAPACMPAHCCAQDDVAARRAELEAYVLLHAAAVPPDVTELPGVSFRMARAADAQPTPSAADLLPAALRRGGVHFARLNPFLSQQACEALHAATLLWARLCVLEDRLCRVHSMVAAHAPAPAGPGQRAQVAEDPLLLQVRLQQACHQPLLPPPPLRIHYVAHPAYRTACDVSL